MIKNAIISQNTLRLDLRSFSCTPFHQNFVSRFNFNLRSFKGKSDEEFSQFNDKKCHRIKSDNKKTKSNQWNKTNRQNDLFSLYQLAKL